MVVFFLFTGMGKKLRDCFQVIETKKLSVQQKKIIFCYLCTKIILLEEETSWHLWAGVNTHSKDNECYQHGIGGMGIEGNEDYFAHSFFEYLGWEFED